MSEAPAAQLFPVPSERGGVTYTHGSGFNNTLLAAALAAMGIKFEAKRGLIQTRGDGIASGGRFTYYFEECSYDGKHKTDELIKAWEDQAWHDAHPEHPFAYIKCALLNRERLVDMIKDDVPLVMHRHRGKIALLSQRASQSNQDKVFQRLTQRRNT
jgi:hypothetical protein